MMEAGRVRPYRFQIARLEFYSVLRCRSRGYTGSDKYCQLKYVLSEIDAQPHLVVVNISAETDCR